MAETNQRQPRVLNVHLNQAEVGTLTLLPDDRTLFAFSESYIENPRRPALSQWFKTDLGELRTEEKLRGQATLPPFFSNLLPEGHLRQYLAQRLGVKPEREFFLLAALGQDLPGAVRVTTTDTIDDDQLTEHISVDGKDASVLRFSLAGVQLKFSAVAEPSGGLTIRADGAGGCWIVKLPSHSFVQVPEAEFSMLTLARQIGINVPACKLIPTNRVNGLPEGISTNPVMSLAIERFDRQDNGARIHMEDFAQVFGLYPNQKYDSASFDRIGSVILTECGEDDFVEFIRRLVFTVMTGNGDMHVKNWSLLYSDPRQPRLAPAYDLVPTVAYLPGDDLGLKLGGTKAFRELSISSFAKLASRTRASERLVLRTVQDTLTHITDAWLQIGGDLPLPRPVRTTLSAHMDMAISRLTED